MEREVRIAARPEIVFGFFTDPAKMIRWKGTDAALDTRPGGAYRVNMSSSTIVKGEYVEVVPFRRVVFTWGWEGDPSVPPGSSTVEVDLIADADATIVRLRHSGLSPEAALLHTQGWEHYLARLTAVAEDRDPGPDSFAEA